MGNENLVNDDDYPDFGYAVAKRVATDENAHGIVICGNAQGICIVANKVKGVRAATGFNQDVAKSAREDDNSNILCLPGRHLDKKKRSRSSTHGSRPTSPAPPAISVGSRKSLTLRIKNSAQLDRPFVTITMFQ